MTLHNYRSRQVHETLNGVNPSSGFRDMRSSKSGPNLWQIWQVFGPWASPYRANDHDNAQLQASTIPQNFEWRKSVKGLQRYGFRKSGSRPPGPWGQYPSSQEGWGVISQLQANEARDTNTFSDCSANLTIQCASPSYLKQKFSAFCMPKKNICFHTWWEVWKLRALLRSRT